MEFIRLNSDYTQGAHQSIIDLLVESNMVMTSGYGEDEYCEKAKESFKKTGEIIYLKLEYSSIEERLGNFSDRGIAFKEAQTLRDLYQERMPLYENCADITIECEGKDLKSIVEEITKVYKEGLLKNEA